MQVCCSNIQYTTEHLQADRAQNHTLSNLPIETGMSTQNFCIAKSISDAEVNFVK